jgi:hypothetical protein
MAHTLKLVGWLIALLVIPAGLYALYLYVFYDPNPSQLTRDLEQLVDAKVRGDDASALAQYQQILSDPTSTAEERAIADIYIAGTEFSVSGNLSSRIDDVRKMKRIVTDSSMSATVRAAAMSVLGNAYTVSGGDPAVFAEIYKDAPFDSYLIVDRPQLSAINLLKESYAIKPSSFAASKVAELASGRYFANPQQDASSTAAYVALAEDYLNKADIAALSEANERPATYASSDRYILYRLSRAITVGRLAIQKGEPYTDTYRTEFNSFIAFAQSIQSTLAHNAVFNARFQYARILEAEGDTAGEKAQLDMLARELSKLPNPNTIPFVLSLRNARTQPTEAMWRAVQRMSSTSPEFKTAVEKLTAVSSN